MKLNIYAFFITTMKPLTLLLSLPSSCLWFLLVSSLYRTCFSNQNSEHVLCIPTERLALVDLKNNLTDESKRLSSWVGKDCCSWSGVVCDNNTGHVHEIHLHGPNDGIQGHCYHGNYGIEQIQASRQMLGGTISPSVTKLSQLRYLDLSCNDFGNSLIPKFIGYFQNLIYLNLSRSQFSGEIPPHLGNLSTLCVLDLHGDPNYLSNLHSRSLTWLKNLKGLEYLDLGHVDLTNASDWFPVVSNFTSLRKLHFYWCGLNKLPSNLTTVSFTSLTVLDLSSNPFEGMIARWIFSLRNLVVLDLTDCYITGVYPGTYGGFNSMPSLRTLRVSGNTFVNSSSILNGLSSLSNLRLLDVSHCHISSPILGNLQNLSFIEHVDLSNNQIVDEIPKILGNLCNITTLDLNNNNLYGNVSELLERFCECESPKLELLAFGANHLTGQLPERLGKLKNLIRIEVGYNNLTGTIPDSLGSLSLLKILNINVNQLSGSIPDTIGGLSSLVSLDLSYNKINGTIPDSLGSLSLLQTLWINVNQLSGLIPNTISGLLSLETLELSFNKLSGSLPEDILQLSKLDYLSLHHNSLTGTIIRNHFANVTAVLRLSYMNMSYNNIQGMLEDVTFLAHGATLDLSNNHLHGMLPGNLNREDMDFLDLSNNNLSGSLEQFLCSSIQEPKSLEVLNLGNNNMSGVIPDCWMYWQNLLILNLEKNQFYGTIPQSLGNISFLLSLDMDNNKLSGNLPLWLLNSGNIVVIELAHNELTGGIPISKGSHHTSLRVLSLRSNKFEGKIPDELCHLSSIQILDLAHNDFSGNLPRCFSNLSVMSGRETSSPIILYETTSTASLVTKGNTHTYSNILYLVTALDLSKNKFSGPIPDELVSLLGLRFLNLSQNDLTGTIPNLFSQTGKLESLDLSMNHLHGNIPLSMSQLTALNSLNLSYNNLVGRIPTGPQLQTFDESSFTGNALCGNPLPECLENDGDTEGTVHQHEESNGIDWILVILTLVGLVVGFWMVITPLFLSKRWRIAYYHYLEEIWFKFQNFFFLLFLPKSLPKGLTKRCRSRS